MEHYILRRWEAIELFVKIIAKYEAHSEQDVQKNLTQYLTKYRRSYVSAKVAKEALKPLADNIFGLDNYYPNFLSDLSKEVESGIPLPRTKTRILLMLEYINEAKQFEHYEIANRQLHKKDTLVGSKWWIYSHKVFHDIKTKERKLLINRDPLSLTAFNYALLITANTHDGKNIDTQNYNGSYYTKDNRYLMLDMCIAETKDKELRIMIDIGAATIKANSIFTGYYLNASNNISFGPVLFEKIDKEEDFSAQFFKDDDPKLDTIIWKFFDGISSTPNKLVPSYGAAERIGNFLTFS